MKYSIFTREICFFFAFFWAFSQQTCTYTRTGLYLAPTGIYTIDPIY